MSDTLPSSIATRAHAEAVGTSIRSDETKDAVLFGSLFDPEASFRIGSLPRVVGGDAIRDFVTGFFTSVAKLEHHVLEAWDSSDTLIYRAEALVTRHDGTLVSLPYVNVLKFSGDRVRDYQVFIDLAPLR